MAHAEKCPVCNGRGEKSDPKRTCTAPGEILITCNGCAGKGWIEVSDTITQVDILEKAHKVGE